MPPLFYITMIFELFVGLVGISRFNKMDIPLRYLVGTILFWFVAGTVERVMGIYGIRNLWLTQCNTLIGLALFVRIYFLWKTSRIHGLILIYSFSGYVAFWIISKFTFEPISGGDDVTSSVSVIFILITTIYLMIQLQKEGPTLWKDDSRFWTSSAYIIYSVGTFFIFSLFSYMLHVSQETLLFVYPINWILIIISHLLFLFAFLCKPASAGIIYQSPTSRSF